MARLYLLIDGYNLMHADGLGGRRKIKSHSDQNRAEFLKRLHRKLNPELHADTIVVFDGIEDAGPKGASATSVLNVRFSGPQSDADTEIEQLLAVHSSPKQVLVVSSDHRLHKAAARRRAMAVDSDVFWDLIDDMDVDDFQESFSSLNSRRTRGSEKPANPGDIELPEDFLDFDSR